MIVVGIRFLTGFLIINSGIPTTHVIQYYSCCSIPFTMVCSALHEFPKNGVSIFVETKFTIQIYDKKDSIVTCKWSPLTKIGLKWAKYSFKENTGVYEKFQIFVADRDVWYHPVYSIYKDACRKQPGEDYEWAVGNVF